MNSRFARIVASFLLAFTLMMPVREANSLIVFDPAVWGEALASRLNELMSYLQQIEDYMNQVQQLENAIQQTMMMATNMIKLPMNIAKKFISDVMSLKNVLNDIQGLGKDVMNIGNDFTKMYGGYSVSGSGSVTSDLKTIAKDVNAIGEMVSKWAKQTSDANKEVFEKAKQVQESTVAQTTAAEGFREQAMSSSSALEVGQAQANLQAINIKALSELRQEMQTLARALASANEENKKLREAKSAFSEDFFGVDKWKNQNSSN